jgi:dTDP-4-amino-4,6-dideoxygalactose transaminase
MKIRMFDLAIKKKKKLDLYSKELKKFLKKGIFFLGPEVEKIEKKISTILNVKYSIGVSSGSSALYLALKACGIKKDDEVILSPLGWIITAQAIKSCGAKPIFADVLDDLNIDPSKIEKKISRRTKAIVPMHYAGHICQMDKIIHIAKKYNLKVIEDAAQSFGGSISGKKSGTFSTAAAFSMNPMKSLGGLGENGFVVTNSKEIYNKVKILRHAGTISDPKKIITNYCKEVSLNHKMDPLNAIFLNLNLRFFKKKLEIKNKIAKKYFLSFKNNKNIICQDNYINFKKEIPGRYVYPILANNRNKLQKFLASKNIETKIFHLPLINNTPIFDSLITDKTVNAQRLVNKLLILPLNEKLIDKEVDYITTNVNKFYKINKLK